MYINISILIHMYDFISIYICFSLIHRLIICKCVVENFLALCTHTFRSRIYIMYIFTPTGYRYIILVFSIFCACTKHNKYKIHLEKDIVGNNSVELHLRTWPWRYKIDLCKERNFGSFAHFQNRFMLVG